MNIRNPFSPPDPNPKVDFFPVLRIGEDRGPLAEKLAEYRRRIKDNSFRAPEERRPLADSLELSYRIAILEKLLATGEVNTSDLLTELESTGDHPFNRKAFNSACGVIEDYIKTGGKNLKYGTGLPKRSGEVE